MKKFVALFVLAALFALAVPASAKPPRIGDRINVLAGTPTTFDAGAPFHIAHGWLLERDNGPIGTYGFSLEIDGVTVPADFVENTVSGGPGGPTITRFWVFNFPEGMAGTHSFTGHWTGRCRTLVDVGLIPGPCANPNEVVDAFSNTLEVEFTP